MAVAMRCLVLAHVHNTMGRGQLLYLEVWHDGFDMGYP
jgi:hypothetical protein